MRMTILAVSVMAAATTLAFPGGAPPATVIQPRLHAVELPGNGRRGAEIARSITAEAAKPVSRRFDFRGEMPKCTVPISAPTKTHILDNITTTQNGMEISRQRFEYFENGLSHLCVNEMLENGEWTPVEEYGYEWDDDGYCLSQWGRTYDGMSGMKNEFSYNDRKLGIEKLISYYSDFEWTPSEKGEYLYDDYGNLIEETISLYDANTQTWNPIMRNRATWTPDGIQTSFETYTWTGEEWYPADDKKIYEYDADGHIILYGFYLWDGADWIYFYRLRQEFEDGLCTLQTNEFWNPDENDWTGCYPWKGVPLYSTRTDLAYDSEHRQIKETAYKIDDPVQGWRLTGDCDFTYTPLDNGGERMQRDMYLYDVSDKLYGMLVKEFDRAGNCTFTHEKMDILNTGTMINIFEETYRYLDEKYLCYGETFQYSQDEANVKMAESCGEYDYDDLGNVVESRHGMGAFMLYGEGDPTEFVPYSRFIYSYQNGNVCTEELAYHWNGQAYDPNYGSGMEYDFDIPVVDCIVWQDLKMTYTVLKNIVYSGDGGDWSDMTANYNYRTIGDGVEGVAAGNARIHGLTGAIGYSGLEGETLIVYAADGRVVAAVAGATDGHLQLPAGLYIVKTGSGSRKVMVR